MTEEFEMEWLEGESRGDSEVRYALEIRGCPRCTSHDIGDPTGNWYTTNGRHAGHLDLLCPGCQLERRIAFYDMANKPSRKWSWPEDRVLDRELPGDMPSTVISAVEFASELARCHSLFNPSFVGMPPDVFVRMRTLISSAMTAVLELRKFVPAGADRVPPEAFRTPTDRAHQAANPLQFERAELDRELQRWIAHDNAGEAEMHRRSDLPKDALERTWPATSPKPRMAQPLSSLSIKLHKAWLSGRGGEKLEATGLDANGKSLADAVLNQATLTKVILDRADLSASTFVAATLTDVSARGAKAPKTNFVAAELIGCDFSAAIMTRALFTDATNVVNSRFTGANLSLTHWVGAAVKACDFSNADLSNANVDADFTDCDFRNANFGCTDPLVGGRSHVTYTRCDFRGASFAGRDLTHTSFTDCKLAGSTGKPTVRFGEITRADLSSAGDGSQIGTKRDVWLQWGVDPDAQSPTQPLAPPTTHMVRYDLEMTDGGAVTRELTRLKIHFTENMVLRGTDVRLELQVQEPIGASRKPMIDEVIAQHRTPHVATPEQLRFRAQVEATRRIEEIIDVSLVDKLSLDECIDALVRHGLTREEAEQAATDPTSIARILMFREGEPGKTE